MIKFFAAGNFVNWPKDLKKDDRYINEEAMYKLLFPSQQPKAKDFIRHCCNVFFPYVWQQPTNKMVDYLRYEDQQAITNRYKRIQATQYEDVALQAQRDVYQTQLQRCENNITHVRTTYIDYARYPGKDNIIIIVRKHTTSANDKYHDLHYYISRIQRRKRYVYLRWLSQHFPDHEVIMEIDSPNNIHAFNRFEEEGYAKQRYNNFRMFSFINKMSEVNKHK